MYLATPLYARHLRLALPTLTSQPMDVHAWDLVSLILAKKKTSVGFVSRMTSIKANRRFFDWT